jgi:hypothetical protein
MHFDNLSAEPVISSWCGSVSSFVQKHFSSGYLMPLVHSIISISFKVQVKQSHYMPWQALRVPGGWGSQISRQSAHEGGKAVSTTHRPPLPQELFLVLTTVTGWVNPRVIVRPKGLCQWKIPVRLSGIEPATFRLVAQCPIFLKA